MKYSLIFSIFLSANTLFAITPHAYVTDQADGSVRVIDAASDKVQTILGFIHPRVVKVTADGTRAYVGSDDNTVRIIDTITNTLLPTVITANHPIALALTPDANYVYIVSTDNTVTVIRTSDFTTVAVLAGFHNAQDIKITPDGMHAYVTNSSGGTISVISTATNTIIDTIAGLKGPVGLTFNTDGAHAYITEPNQNAVVVIQTSDNTIVSRILGFNVPSYIAVTPDKTYAFVSNTGNDTVSIIRTRDNMIVNTIPVPSPKSLAVTADGLHLYVGSGYGTVFKIRILDNAILIAIPGFQNPSNISVTDNNAPADSVNGCQVAISPTNVFNKINWNDGPGTPIGYKIYRDIAFTKLLATLGAGVSQYEDLNRDVGQTYSYYVFAQYADGFSSSIGSVEVVPSRICNGS